MATIDEAVGLAEQAYTDALYHLSHWRAKYASGSLVTANGEYPRFSLPDGTQTDWPAYEAHLAEQVAKAQETLAKARELEAQRSPFEVRTEFGV